MTADVLSRVLDASVEPRPAARPCVDLDAEHDVLGAVLLDESERGAGELGVWPRIAALVTEADFADHRHAAIFAAMVRAKAARRPLTLPVVAAELEAVRRLESCGGRQYLASLADHIPSLAHADAAARVVAENAAARRLGSVLANGARRLAAGANLAATHAAVLSEVRALRLPGVSLPSMADAMEDAARRFEARADGSDREPVVPSSVDDLTDALEGGWPVGLSLLGARPFIGKTLLTTQEVVHAARTRGRVLYLSLEKRRPQIADEMTSYLSGVPLEAIRSTRLNAEQFARWTRAMSELADLPLTVVDLATPGCPRTVPEIEGACLALPEPPVLVAVDHIRKLRPVGRHFDVRHGVGEIAAALHELGMDLGVAVLGLIHVGRAAVKGQTCRVPTMEDLKEAGELEEAADVVAIMHNEGRYPTKKYARGEEPDRDVVEVLVPKRRGGKGGGYARLRLDGAVQRFRSTRSADRWMDAPIERAPASRPSIQRAEPDDPLDRFDPGGEGLPDCAPDPDAQLSFGGGA